MIPCYGMTVATKRWLGKHLLFFFLRYARDALHWFHVWNYDSLSSCHMATCFHWDLLPCIVDIIMFMGRFVWRVRDELEMHIGSMILPNLRVVCFRRNNGHTMISTSHLFPSQRRSHWEDLHSWRRHFMVDLSCGVAWAIFEGHDISAQYQQPPHTYHKWREKLLGWESTCYLLC